MRIWLLSAISTLFAAISCAQEKAAFTSQSNAEFAQTLSKQGIQLLDVRTPAEYTEGHIPGAINMDVRQTDFDKQIAKLNKKYPVAVYCRSGARSKTAAQKLAKKGYQVYELSKGILHWDGQITP